jgi:hypothetical protein
MRALSAARTFHLPLRLHGIQLGRSVDLLLDPAEWRAVGFDVLCGDDASRFLPFTTARIGDDQILVRSALMLLEDIEFYRTRARSVRALLGSKIEVDGAVAGTLRDLELAADGAVAELLLEHEGAERRIVPGAGVSVVASRRDAA